MLLKTITAVLCVIPFVAVTISTPVDTASNNDVRKCQPNFCQIAKFKCISQDSCNGTIIPQTDPCQCCPICVQFKDVGEPCEELFQKSNLVPPTIATSTRILNGTSSLTNDKKNHEHKCKPGLTCLQGNCVIVF